MESEVELLEVNEMTWVCLHSSSLWELPPQSTSPSLSCVGIPSGSVLSSFHVSGGGSEACDWLGLQDSDFNFYKECVSERQFIVEQRAKVLEPHGLGSHSWLFHFLAG